MRDKQTNSLLYILDNQVSVVLRDESKFRQNVMHGLHDFGMSWLTRTSNAHVQLAADPSRALGEYQNAIRKLGRLFDIVRYQHHRARKFVEHTCQLSSHPQAS